MQEEKTLKEVNMQTEEKPAEERQGEPNDLLNYLVGFNDVNVVIDGGAEQQYDVFVEEKQFAEVNIQTEQEEQAHLNQEQKGIEAKDEDEPVIQMKELKPVHVHPVHRHYEQVDNLVLIGRRDRHHQEEEG